MIYSQI